MSEMISVSSGFQYSVNIGYDLNNDDKLRNFIPTQSSLRLLEEILLSTRPDSTERARVLIGPYGKGKSHILLIILSMLLKRDRGLFEKTMPKICEDPTLKQCVDNYYDSENKILPIVINGSYTSLSQAFLVSLQRTLSENGLEIMPETNYKAAVMTIKRWETDFPETFQSLADSLDMPIDRFVEELEGYSGVAYKKFEELYPVLTSGSIFNPFLGFDVVELFEECVKGLRDYGYTGLYVVYDEFSKYLEANIAEASVSDTKMLQDFAEKCNRSGDLQMHIMLICHKEISNYIDKLPKTKVDGWRGVSERFKHIHLTNNYTQTYEIIGTAIMRNEGIWQPFLERNQTQFSELVNSYCNHAIFEDIDEDSVGAIVRNCYPLHPVTTFILPRLSERVAQNERTMFTFLSASGVATLPSFLETYDDGQFNLVTPDILYDYFEPLLMKEAYGGSVHEYHYLAESILQGMDADTLQGKIIKTIALIYILENFEKLQPTTDEIVRIYSSSFPSEEITNAIDDLVNNEYVIYMRRSNGFLRLKQSSGVDVWQKIGDTVEIQRKNVTVKNTLNGMNFDNFMYPSRYNNDHDMTRYFAFEFIDESEVSEEVDWEKKSGSIDADGVIYGIIPHGKRSINKIKKALFTNALNCDRIIFVVPNTFEDIEGVACEYNAACTLRDEASDDKALFDEYDVICDDLREVILSYIRCYTRPEDFNAKYIYCGKECHITRRAALSDLMSQICDRTFSMTPVINNEVINKNEITGMAEKSRGKILAALLRNELEPGLGLTGTGQEVSIMRSTLVRTGILEEDCGLAQLNMRPTQTEHMGNLLKTIETFVTGARKGNGKSFSILYDHLCSPKYHIGLRRGVIPIFVAVVLHKYKREVIVSDSYGQVPLTADVLTQINAKPELFTLSFMEWDDDKDNYVRKLSAMFSDYVMDAERDSNSYGYVATAMKRWYMALPKFAKDSKVAPNGEEIPKEYATFMKMLKSNVAGNELLFVKVPKLFGEYDDCLKGIRSVKGFYDHFLAKAEETMAGRIKDIFATERDKAKVAKMSLSSVIRDWCDSLDGAVFEQLFSDGTERALAIFRNVTNDDALTVENLAKAATDLRIEDWDERVQDLFYDNIRMYKETAEGFRPKDAKEGSAPTSAYQIVYTDSDGNAVTRRFDRVEDTKKGRLLRNQVTAALDSMGRAISDQEKRQVLIEILRELC